MKRINLLAATLALSLGAVCLADDDKPKAKTLSVGDEAPVLKVSHWLKGDEVTEFEEGKVYVVEFWATWCGPCRAGMPHLTSMQKEYKDYDVTILGISDEKLSTVVNFLCKENKKEEQLWNKTMGYTVATDPDRSVYTDYMKAAGQNGIPTAFIVGKSGIVEWIGHPATMDKPLESVVKDTWDRRQFLAEMATERDLQKAFRAGNFDKALELIDLILEKNDNPGLRYQKFRLLLTMMDKPEEAYEEAAKYIESSFENAQALNQISWFIVDEKDLPKRDFELALKAAKQANKLTKFKDGAILDTLARVYYEMGNLKKALNWQRKAVENTDEGSPMYEDLKKSLEQYEGEMDEG